MYVDLLRFVTRFYAERDETTEQKKVLHKFQFIPRTNSTFFEIGAIDEYIPFNDFIVFLWKRWEN